MDRRGQVADSSAMGLTTVLPASHDTDGVSVLLTDRELAVLDLAADGLITAAIARRLGISPRTVGKHLEQAYRKLGANDRVSAVLRAHSLGLVPFPEEAAR
jgi:DNA-binding CsgD family transcriptional regulator